MKYSVLILLICMAPAMQGAQQGTVWGFYGHRLINRMAVFTLPSAMIGLYKFNIDYISDHAVDPDKRRYATPHEAVRHYIDLDEWGQQPFENLPRSWTELLAQKLTIGCVDARGDTVIVHHPYDEGGMRATVPRSAREFVMNHLLRQYYDAQWEFDPDTVHAYFPEVEATACTHLIGYEHFSEHGILPYHLVSMQRRLTEAFAHRELGEVLRLSADFGHYIADAHVPLHTTRNYNGQLTGQDGIHAFWESRVPELFAEQEWDFLVGQARYIDDPETYFWNIVLKSHALVKDVLQIEESLSNEYPQDAQYCFEERLGNLVRTQCADYARAFHDRMAGMVEIRMQDAILAIGSAWFTAWVDGGQPDLGDFTGAMDPSDKAAFEALERAYLRGRAFGRPHEYDR